MDFNACIESLIARARRLLSVLTPEEAIQHLAAEGEDPRLAFLVVKAAAVLEGC